MSNENIDNGEQPTKPNSSSEQSDSASSSSSSSDNQTMRAPVSNRPNSHSQRASESFMLADDGYETGGRKYVTDVGTMSPRRTTEDLEALGRDAREELHRHARALQESLLMLFNQIEAVKEEHDKLDSNNKFLQKYIGDLMSTSKITASSSRGRK